MKLHLKIKNYFNKKGLGNLIWILIFLMTFVLAIQQVLPFYQTVIKLEREKELVFVLTSYKKAILKFKSIYGHFPYKLNDLLKYSPNPKIIRELYNDPNYEFEIDSENKYKKEGFGLKIIKNSNNEIIDIRSNSNKKGINGIPYYKWYIDDNLKLMFDTKSLN